MTQLPQIPRSAHQRRGRELLRNRVALQTELANGPLRPDRSPYDRAVDPPGQRTRCSGPGRAISASFCSSDSCERT
jgi:hypothetical protein